MKQRNQSHAHFTIAYFLLLWFISNYLQVYFLFTTSQICLTMAKQQSAAVRYQSQQIPESLCGQGCLQLFGICCKQQVPSHQLSCCTKQTIALQLCATLLQVGILLQDVCSYSELISVYLDYRQNKHYTLNVLINKNWPLAVFEVLF